MGSLELRIFATYPHQEGNLKTSYETQCDYASYYCDEIDSVIIQKIEKLTSDLSYNHNEECLSPISNYIDQEEETGNKFSNQTSETNNVSSTRKKSKLIKTDVHVSNMIEIDVVKNSYDLKTCFNSCEDENTIGDLKIPFKPPRYQEYVHLTRRISSFIECPELIQSAYCLGEAGFFYAGSGRENLIKCFNCGGSLKNWDPEDDPWIEHAHWFPTCVFLRQNKDDEFIDLIQQLSRNQHGEFENDIQVPEILANGLNKGKGFGCNNDDQICQETGLQTRDISTNSIKGDNSLCKVCMDGDITIVFLPCRHLATCSQCSPTMKNCPICRKNINGTLRAYLS